MKQLEFALKAIRNPAAVKPLVEEFKSGKVSARLAQGRDRSDRVAGRTGDLAVLSTPPYGSTDDAHSASRCCRRSNGAARQRNMKPTSEISQPQVSVSSTRRRRYRRRAPPRRAPEAHPTPRRYDCASPRPRSRAARPSPPSTPSPTSAAPKAPSALTDLAAPADPPGASLAAAALARLDANRRRHPLRQALAAIENARNRPGRPLGAFLNRKNGPASSARR